MGRHRPEAWLALTALAVVCVALALLTSAVVLLRLVPVLLLAAAAVALLSRARRPRTRPVRAASPPAVDWPAARATFARVREEYAAFECDPLAVLRTPALADVSVPATARFVDAFAEVQALDTERPPSPQHQQRFAEAAEQARRAWDAARDAAERIRLSGIPEAERATVERAVALLTLARDSGHAAERASAYARARTELAKLERAGTLRLPRPAAAAIANAARGGLTTGQ